MSLQLINLSPDLQKLVGEGYELEIKSGFLLVKSVPYVNAAKEIKYGTLVMALTLAGNKTTTPQDHQAQFSGELPCNEHGVPLTKIMLNSQTQDLAPGIQVNQYFSAKPNAAVGGAYRDYYEKVTTYVALLCGPAQAIDKAVTAKNFNVVKTEDGESPFRYHDTASSRAEIVMVANKLSGGKIAIIGLGGTGSYILDQIAKTPVQEIHLFDDDLFLQHNAFRAPGAVSVEELNLKKPKVKYFEEIYSKMHRGIQGHVEKITSANVEKLRAFEFVFICIDKGPAKKVIVQKLEEFGISFVDVGLGIYVADGKLAGVVALTASTPQKRDHVVAKHRISFSENDEINEYNKNIQVSDLNALNAVLAVIRWKKLKGFYADFDNEHFSAYTIDGNALVNEDKVEA